MGCNGEFTAPGISPLCIRMERWCIISNCCPSFLVNPFIQPVHTTIHHIMNLVNQRSYRQSPINRKIVFGRFSWCLHVLVAPMIATRVVKSLFYPYICPIYINLFPQTYLGCLEKTCFLHTKKVVPRSYGTGGYKPK